MIYIMKKNDICHKNFEETICFMKILIAVIIGVPIYPSLNILTTNYQLSIINYHLSIINYQLSTVMPHCFHHFEYMNYKRKQRIHAFFRTLGRTR